MDSIGGNIRVGNSDIFLTEACEYTNSFLNFYPKYALILNIEEDHPDFFKNLADVRHSFTKFANNVPDNGTLILNGEIENYKEITENLNCNIVTYGLTASYSYYASNITFNTQGCANFTLMQKEVAVGEISLQVPGLYNVSNALAACALAMEMNFSFSQIQAALNDFHTPERRFEYKGNLGGITIIDDYAHHPTEITATLTTAKACNYQRVICVFQPHTYSRTKKYLEGFVQALSIADIVVLADIYAARETDTLGISSEIIQKMLQNSGCECYYFPSFDQITNFLLKKCINGDMLITMGAGDIVQVGEQLLGK